MRESKAAAEQAHRMQIDALTKQHADLAKQHAEEAQAAAVAWTAKEEAARQLLADTKQKAKADMKVGPPLYCPVGGCLW